jgi:hypothetical protein
MVKAAIEAGGRQVDVSGIHHLQLADQLAQQQPTAKEGLRPERVETGESGPLGWGQHALGRCPLRGVELWSALPQHRGAHERGGGCNRRGDHTLMIRYGGEQHLSVGVTADAGAGYAAISTCLRRRLTARSVSTPR